MQPTGWGGIPAGPQQSQLRAVLRNPSATRRTLCLPWLCPLPGKAPVGSPSPPTDQTCLWPPTSRAQFWVTATTLSPPRASADELMLICSLHGGEGLAGRKESRAALAGKRQVKPPSLPVLVGKSAQNQCYPGGLGLGPCSAAGTACTAWHSPPWPRGCCAETTPTRFTQGEQRQLPAEHGWTGQLSSLVGFACWNEPRRRAGAPAGRRDCHLSPGDTWPTHCIQSLPSPSSCLGWTGAAWLEMAVL